MKIRSLHVEGFGLHCDRRIELRPGLNVIEGRNEAGKSTLHAFICAMFYGTPRGKPFEPLAGGRHAGTLHLEGPEGLFRVERIFSPRKSLKVEGGDGKEGGQALLDDLLGRTDAALYRSVFAFDLDELRDLSSLEGEAIEHRLFDAGLLGAGVSFSEVIGALRKVQEEGLKPRSGRLRDLARTVGEREAALREAHREVKEHAALAEEERALEAQIQAVRRASDERGEALRRLRLLSQLWETEVKRRRAAEALAAPAPLAIPWAEARVLAQRLADLDGGRGQLERSLEGRSQQRKVVLAELEDLAPDPVLAALAEEFTPLWEAKGGLRVQRERRLELEREIVSKDEAIRGLLASLGEGWDLERALAVDCTLAREEALRGAGDELLEAEAAQREREGALGRLVEERQRVAGEAAEARAAAEALGAVVGAERLEAQRGALADLRAAREEKRSAEQRRDALLAAGPRGGEKRVLLGTISLAMVGFAVWAFSLGQGLFGSALLFVALLVGTFALLRGKAGGAPAEPLARVEEELRAHERVLQESAGILDLSLPVTASDLEATAERLRREEERWRQRQGAEERLGGLERRLAEFDRSLEAAQAAREESGRRVEAAQRAWQAASADLGEGLRPEGAKERLRRVAQIQEQHARLRREAQERDRLAAQDAAWREAVGDLLRRAAISEEGEGGLALLHRRLEEQGERRQKRAEAEARLRTLEGGLAHDRGELETIDAEIQAILERGGASDRAGFEAKVEEARLRAEAAEALEAAERELLERLGAGERAEALRRELATGELAAWEEQIHPLEEAEREAKDRLQALGTELGALRDRRGRIEASADIPRLSAELAQLKSELEEEVVRWRRAALLELLLKEAFEELHQAQQPAVLRHAGGAFAAVTGGRYVSIRQTGDKQVDVLDPKGKALQASVLSRGTTEQLYLCLRLGLAAAFAEQGIRLPLLMDDVLVNFDPERAQAMARVLGDFAQAHQVLLFTCHPTTTERLLEAAPGTHVVHMEAS